MSGPLEGVRIVELGTMIAVPAATELLASYGASVIKVEDTITGDQLRFYGTSKGGMSAWFLNANAGKRSVAIDLKSEPGREVLWRLIDQADVLVEGFRSGVMDRLGFGYEAVSARHPRIVYCASSGFGPSGPYADRPVFDPLIQSLSGWAGAQQVDGGPSLVRAMVADKVGAYNNAQAIMAALFQQARTGRGSHIQTNMLDANLAFVWPDAMMHCTLVDDEDVEHEPNLLQTYRLFACTDGWISMALGNDAQWQAACEAVDRVDLLEDERFTTPARRSANIHEWYLVQDEMTRDFSVEELVERMIAADVPVSPVRLPENVFDDPHIQSNGMMRESAHPVAGRYRHPQARANALGPDLELEPAPTWGEQTVEILRELDYADARIADLVQNGNVKAPVTPDPPESP
jgi:crotonobetainyl-CoA:carnitine CoA-transferase CaiB-like acyl-CoA transferase